MAVAALDAPQERARTATGLLPSEIGAMSLGERRLLTGWHEGKAGDDHGRPWWPWAVRRLEPAARLHLASDTAADVAWEERERQRVAAGREYFVRCYGHVQDDDDPGAPPVPFLLWPEQEGVLADMAEHRRVVVLKARQLGLTWLALHAGFHLIAFDPERPNATVLLLSQDGNYAKRNLERARRIRALLPPFLRPPETRETADSKSELVLVRGGRVISLPGTPSAPRTYTADLAIGDEWAFVRNQYAGPTLTALLSAARRIILVSSGNGPEDVESDGAAFAHTFTRAVAGQNDFHPVFLPTSTHPARDEAWRERERQNYQTEEDFLAEHPETVDEALIGSAGNRVYSPGGIAAAVKLGAAYDTLLGTEHMPPPAGECIHIGLDWGDHFTAGLVLWPLEGGGLYVAPGEFGRPGVEPGEVCDEIHRGPVADLQSVDPDTGEVGPPIGEARFDAAGAQSMRAFMARARERYSPLYDGHLARPFRVPFAKFKSETIGYLRRLFNRAAQGRKTGIIAISPTNVMLIRQLRGLEFGPDGKVRKVEDDLPDALIAGAAPVAARNRA